MQAVIVFVGLLLALSNSDGGTGWSSGGVRLVSANNYTLHVYGNADTNDYSCSAMGPVLGSTITDSGGGCTGGAPGSCFVCTAVPTINDVVTACTGRSHTLAVTGNGTLYGTGALAMLGLGSAAGTTEFATGCFNSTFTEISLTNGVGIASGVTAVNVSCGVNYSAVFLSDEKVAFFGFNENGVSGTDPATKSFYDVPTVIDVLTPVGLSSTGGSDPTITSVHAGGTDSLIFLLSNGSLITTGQGDVRSIDASSTNGAPTMMTMVGDGSTAAASTPEYLLGSCSVVTVSVGFKHVLALCSNGTILGWGENQYKQISIHDNSTLIYPTDTNFLLGGDVNKVSLSAGNTQSMLLDRNSDLVFVRGSNNAGESGFPVATTVSSSWTAMTSTVYPTPKNFQGISAGNGYSLVVTKGNSLSAAAQGRAYSNVFATGSNDACALGIGSNVSVTTQSYGLLAVPWTVETNLHVVQAITGEYKRVLLLTEQLKTYSTTDTLSLSPSRTPNETRTQTDTLPLTVTASHRSDSVSVTATDTPLPTPTQGPTSTQTFTKSLPPTATRGQSTSKTSSVSQHPQPAILHAKVYYSPKFQLLVTFTVPTDQGGTTSNSTHPDLYQSVNRIVVVTGAKQTLGGDSGYTGYWMTNEVYAVTLDSAQGANITSGIGILNLGPYSNIRNTDSRSFPASTSYSVPIVAATARVTAVPAAAAPTDSTWPWWAIFALVLLIVLIIALLVIGFVFFMKTGTQKQKRKERKRELDKAKAQEDADVEHTSRSYRVEEFDGEDTLTFSSHRGNATARDLSPTNFRNAGDEPMEGGGCREWSKVENRKSGMMIELGPSPARPCDPIGHYLNGDNAGRSATRLRFVEQQFEADPIYVGGDLHGRRDQFSSYEIVRGRHSARHGRHYRDRHDPTVIVEDTVIPMRIEPDAASPIRTPMPSVSAGGSVPLGAGDPMMSDDQSASPYSVQIEEQSPEYYYDPHGSPHLVAHGQSTDPFAAVEMSPIPGSFTQRSRARQRFEERRRRQEELDAAAAALAGDEGGGKTPGTPEQLEGEEDAKSNAPFGTSKKSPKGRPPPKHGRKNTGPPKSKPSPERRQPDNQEPETTRPHQEEQQNPPTGTAQPPQEQSPGQAPHVPAKNHAQTSEHDPQHKPPPPLRRPPPSHHHPQEGADQQKPIKSPPRSKPTSPPREESPPRTPQHPPPQEQSPSQSPKVPSKNHAQTSEHDPQHKPPPPRGRPPPSSPHHHQEGAQQKPIKSPPRSKPTSPRREESPPRTPQHPPPRGHQAHPQAAAHHSPRAPRARPPSKHQPNAAPEETHHSGDNAHHSSTTTAGAHPRPARSPPRSKPVSPARADTPTPAGNTSGGDVTQQKRKSPPPRNRPVSPGKPPPRGHQQQGGSEHHHHRPAPRATPPNRRPSPSPRRHTPQQGEDEGSPYITVEQMTPEQRRRTLL